MYVTRRDDGLLQFRNAIIRAYRSHSHLSHKRNSDNFLPRELYPHSDVRANLSDVGMWRDS